MLQFGLCIYGNVWAASPVVPRIHTTLSPKKKNEFLATNLDIHVSRFVDRIGLFF